jgi:hypothetical protein
MASSMLGGLLLDGLPEGEARVGSEGAELADARLHPLARQLIAERAVLGEDVSQFGRDLDQPAEGTAPEVECASGWGYAGRSRHLIVGPSSRGRSSSGRREASFVARPAAEASASS